MREVKYAMSIIRGKLKNADEHNLHYQRFSIADMEAILGVLSKSESDYAALQQKLDSLAAENAALKSVLEPKEISDEIQDLFNDTVKLDGDSDGYHEWSWVDNPDEVIISVMNAMPKPETPATDAYMNSVRAEGVLMAHAALIKYAFPTMRAAYTSDAENMVEDLRSVTHDTADKAD